MANQVVNQVKAVVTDFKDHWSEPKKGRNVPYKEIVAYGVGGAGVNFACTITGTVTLSASTMMVGSCIGLEPLDIYYMSIVANIFGILMTMIRSWCFDNTKSEEGKFRPYLKWSGIPMVIVSIAYVWMPYEAMEYSQKVATVLIFYCLINAVGPFYSESFSLLLQVISPDSDERTDLMSIGQIIYSIAPSITNLIIPFLAVGLFDGLTDIRTYRYIYPIISIIGLFIAYPGYKYTHERIIKPKSQENSVRFMDAVRTISKNKYFWIYNSGSWVGFLEGAYKVIITWSFVYAFPEQQQYLGVANTIIGNGALWSMLAAPFLIRRFGKRNLLIWCNLANIVLMALLYPFINNIWMIVVIFYVNNFVAVLSNIYSPGIKADIKDYQQYVTGERVDGMFTAMEEIGTVIGFATDLVIPYIYELCGLHDDYDVLYDDALRTNLFQVLIVCSVIGAIMNVIPYLFYDLTEEKHKGIVGILHIRTMFIDYADGALDDPTLIEGMEIIHTAKELNGEKPLPIDKTELNRAKKMPKKTPEEKEARHEAIKEARAEIRKTRDTNTQIATAPAIVEELQKFETVRYQLQVERAKFVTEHREFPLKACEEYYENLKATAKKDTKEEKSIYNDISLELRGVAEANKLLQKYYANGFNDTEEALNDELQNAQNLPSDSIVKFVHRKLEVKKVSKKISNFKRILKPFTDAERLVKESVAYEHMEDLEAMYNSAMEREAETVTA